MHRSDFSVTVFLRNSEVVSDPSEGWSQTLGAKHPPPGTGTYCWNKTFLFHSLYVSLRVSNKTHEMEGPLSTGPEVR